MIKQLIVGAFIPPAKTNKTCFGKHIHLNNPYDADDNIIRAAFCFSRSMFAAANYWWTSFQTGLKMNLPAYDDFWVDEDHTFGWFDDISLWALLVKACPDINIVNQSLTLKCSAENIWCNYRWKPL